MKKILGLLAVMLMAAACEETPEPQEDGLCGQMNYFFVDEQGNDLLDPNDPDMQYPVHFQTGTYQAPTHMDYEFYSENGDGKLYGVMYSGNHSTITYDEQAGLYCLFPLMPFSNLSKDTEIVYTARSTDETPDVIRAELIFLTEGVIGGGPDPRHPQVQKLYYNEVLILDEQSRGEQKTYIVKKTDGTTSVLKSIGDL